MGMGMERRGRVVVLSEKGEGGPLVNVCIVCKVCK